MLFSLYADLWFCRLYHDSASHPPTFTFAHTTLWWRVKQHISQTWNFSDSDPFSRLSFIGFKNSILDHIYHQLSSLAYIVQVQLYSETGLEFIFDKIKWADSPLNLKSIIAGVSLDSSESTSSSKVLHSLQCSQPEASLQKTFVQTLNAKNMTLELAPAGLACMPELANYWSRDIWSRLYLDSPQLLCVQIIMYNLVKPCWFSIVLGLVLVPGFSTSFPPPPKQTLGFGWSFPCFPSVLDLQSF